MREKLSRPKTSVVRQWKNTANIFPPRRMTEKNITIIWYIICNARAELPESVDSRYFQPRVTRTYNKIIGNFIIELPAFHSNNRREHNIVAGR